MSVDDCRNQVMNCSEANEVRVEVNQRHLIDKMLARYASEFVIFRELMQNADDAKATAVQIIFSTEKSGKLNTITGINNARHTKYARIQFRNNGFAFRPEDWNRLKKIAEGNPDEKKIGAFGVGFYSLFSVCEQPFVSSGGQGMAFYWHGDQLLAKQATTSVKDEWTTFLMDVREPAEFPDLDKFGRFLATSLGFTVNLREVSVYFDDHNHCIIHLKKQMGNPRSMAIRSDINKCSPKNMFKLESVEVCDVQLNVRRIIPTDMSLSKSLFRNYPTENASIRLCVASGNLKVQVQKEFVAEMERMTKKKPPSQTTMHLIFTRNDDNFEFKNKMSKIFQDLLPFPEQGRIFIGFRTHQTTGCSVHIAARVIPTVERESIDFADKTLSVYNSEMLCLAGVLCRLLYEDEMSQVANLYQKLKLTDSVRELLEKRAAHALAHFNFHPSTPDPQVEKIIEPQFFNCNSSWFPIISTSCIDTISKVRLPNPEMATFVKSVSVVPKILMDQCEAFFKMAKDKKLIEEISIDDVFKELKSRILSEDEIIDLIRWWISYCSKQNIPKDQFDQFMKLTIIRVGKFDLPLKNFRYFLNPSKIQPDADLPPNLFPYGISKKFNKDDFKCFNWTELTLVEWTQYIVDKPELENDAKYVDKFWEVLSRNINSISNDNQTIIYKLLYKKKCIPTKLGLKRPKQTYFPNVTLFSDLPNINMKYFNKIPEKFFIKLGVRKCVELQLVFDRLASPGNLDHMQLVKYFTQNEEHLKRREIEKLKSTAIWLREQQFDNVNVIKYGKIGSMNNISRFEDQRCLAKDLYVPYAQNRDLGLPVIQWKGRWNNNANEEKFLIKLGLQLYPSLQTVLKLATPVTNITIRNKALDFFIKNFYHYREVYDATLIQEKFLPCIDGTYAKPSECFSNCECTVMRFNSLRQDLCNRAEELGIRQHPSSEKLLKRLSQEPPKSIYEAKKIFNYLASRRGDFDYWDWKTLANLSFIPIQHKSSFSKITYTTPKNCFLKSSDERFIELFPHVDFGENANKFLENCGVRLNPSPATLAERLVTSSEEFYNEDIDKYITILNIIACDLNSIENNKNLFNKMCQSPILLGLKKPEQYHLARADDIFIHDNAHYAKIFNPLICPFKDNLEKLYKALGCRSLDASVKETPQPKGKVTTSQTSDEVQQKILERLPIYYNEITNDNIRNNEEWINKLKVKEIQDINISYTLDTIVKIEPARACVGSESDNSLVLYVTRNKIDYFDISKALLNYIHKNFRRENISHMYNILTQSQEFLERLCPSNYILKANKGKIHGLLPKTKWSAPVSIITLEVLQDELLNLINSCRSNLEGTVDNQATVNTLTDCKTYCDIIPELSLTYVGVKNEIKLYIAKNLDSSIILSKSMENTLMCFINILINLADVFGIKRDKIHIFYDNYSSSIAFNRQNALFFSLKYYIESHYSENSTLSSNAMISWFMTFCHELAHNAIKQHSSKHEYYLQSFAKLYMPKLFNKMQQLNISF